jgi:siroheme synthase-like protein
MPKKDSYYPVFMDIRGKRCAVIGGGRVALRKIKRLLDGGAAVEVISPELCEGLEEIVKDGRVTYCRRPYRGGDIKGACLAFAATGSNEVNRQVAAEARSLGIPVNTADGTETSDFIVPSLVQRGNLAVAVSTGGGSPALARSLRRHLEETLLDECAALTELASEIRAELMEQGLHPDGQAWEAALDLNELLPLLRTDREAARERILQKLMNCSGDIS